MRVHPLRTAAFVALFVVLQAKASFARFLPGPGARFAPPTGSFSKVSNNAYEREVNYGPIGVTKGVSNSHTFIRDKGGFWNGGSTSIVDRNAVSRELNLGGLDIGSSLSHTRSRTNGAVSHGLSHELNVGKYGIETSLSADNVHKGIGLQRSSDGDLELGLGPLRIDLSRNAQQQEQALTHAQVNAYGEDARAKANSFSQSQTQKYGKLGITDTFSSSSAVGHTRFGHITADTGGAATNQVTNGQNYHPLRAARNFPSLLSPILPFVARSKRHAQRIKFRFPDDDDRAPQFGQQAAANTHSKQEYNQMGFFQDTGGSSIGSNLANDGSRGQVSSANVAQMHSQTAAGSMSTNNAQSQSLNFDPNQQQASSANAGTKHIVNENSERIESSGGSQSTNNNPFGTTSNIANTNTAVYREGDTQGSEAGSSSQSIFQGKGGQNAAAQTGSNVQTIRGPGGSVSSSASSNASAVSKGNQSANAVASASSSSGPGTGNNAFSNAQSNVGGFAGFGGVSANSGASGNFGGFGGFPYWQRGFPTDRKSSRRQQALFRRQQAQKTQPQEELEHSQHLKTESKVFNPGAHSVPQSQGTNRINISTDQIGTIDGNKRYARTFSFITDLIRNFSQPRCIYPCTLEAYQENRCCDTIIVAPQPPLQCCRIPPIPPLPPLPPQPPLTTPVLVTPPLSIHTMPLIPTICCDSCSNFAYYGPPLCVPYNFVRSPLKVRNE